MGGEGDGKEGKKRRMERGKQRKKGRMVGVTEKKNPPALLHFGANCYALVPFKMG